MICIAASYVAAFLPLFCISLYFLQRFYLRTSCQLRLLELEARSLLYTILHSTVEGLDTISAFKWQHAFQQRLLKLLDASQKPYYLLFCIQQWLILVLGLMVAAMALLVVAFALEFRQISSSGSIGVGLIAIMQFNEALDKLIIQWTSLETSLGAIARLKSFSQDTVLEDDDTDARAEGLDVWPESGEIEFCNATASFRFVPKALLAISVCWRKMLSHNL
jgi:ATP-binding cassette subfamily C (CFTR/MRP) protein 1